MTENLSFHHGAMTAPWQILIWSEDENTRKYAPHAAAQAFTEVDKVESAMSRFLDSSDISQINAAPAGTPVIVGIHTMECLKIAVKAAADTGGLFDVTVGPLILAWRNPDKTPRTPTPEELKQARDCVGTELLELDEKQFTVTPKRDCVTVDLGGIAKGYAADRAAEVLREWDITRALISAGTSTVVALDPPQDREGWSLGVGGVGAEPEPPYALELNNAALSGSGEYARGSHIINPSTGRPAEHRLSAWALCSTGAMADALSTAFVIMERGQIRELIGARPEVSAMTAEESEGGVVLQKYGRWPGLKPR